MAGHLTATSLFVNTSGQVFIPIGSKAVSFASGTTETDISWVTRNAGTWSKLQCYVVGNASTAVSVTFRKNTGSDGNQVLSIGTTANTYFEDTSNSDTVAAGDALCLKYSQGNASSVTTQCAASLFTPSGSDYVVRVGVGTSGGQSFTTAGTDFLQSFNENFTTGGNDTITKTVIETTCVAKNLYSNVSTNARTTTTNMRLWKNNAAGNLIIPYTSGQTGIKEDTSNTDSFSAGDTANMSVSTASADSGSIVMLNIFCDFTSADGTLPYTGYNAGNIAANLTRYLPIQGRGNNNITTEAQVQLKAESNGTLEKSSIVVSANGNTGTTNLRTRINGGPGNNVRVIGSGVTGTIIDTSNTDTVVASDLVDLEIATGATGGNFTGRQAMITFTIAATNIVKDLLQMGIIPFARA